MMDRYNFISGWETLFKSDEGNVEMYVDETFIRVDLTWNEGIDFKMIFTKCIMENMTDKKTGNALRRLNRVIAENIDPDVEVEIINFRTGEKRKL